VFIKYYVTKEIDTTRRNIKTMIALMVKRVAKKYIFFSEIGVYWYYIGEDKKSTHSRKSEESHI